MTKSATALIPRNMNRPVVLLLFVSSLLAGCELPQQQSRIVLPAPDSEGAQLMKEFCSDCHAPPSPAAHSAREWPNVVYRMHEHRRMQAYSLMNEQQEAALLDYLKQFAKG